MEGISLLIDRKGKKLDAQTHRGEQVEGTGRAVSSTLLTGVRLCV